MSIWLDGNPRLVNEREESVDLLGAEPSPGQAVQTVVVGEEVVDLLGVEPIDRQGLHQLFAGPLPLESLLLLILLHRPTNLTQLLLVQLRTIQWTTTDGARDAGL